MQQLLKSLVEQDYPNEKMEIVIVSDRSTDGTWQIINDFSNLYPFVKGIKLEDINDDNSSIYLCSNQQISNFQKSGIGFKDLEPSYKHML